MSIVNFWFSLAALNIATDILVLALPMPALYSLKLPCKQKAGLIGVFAIGAL